MVVTPKSRRMRWAVIDSALGEADVASKADSATERRQHKMTVAEAARSVAVAGSQQPRCRDFDGMGAIQILKRYEQLP